MKLVRGITLPSAEVQKARDLQRAQPRKQEQILAMPLLIGIFQITNLADHTQNHSETQVPNTTR